MQACSLQQHGVLGLTLTAESTTALFACCSRGMTRSTMLSASLASVMDILATASKMYTCSGLWNCGALFNRANSEGHTTCTADSTGLNGCPAGHGFPFAVLLLIKAGQKIASAAVPSLLCYTTMRGTELQRHCWQEAWAQVNRPCRSRCM